MNRGHGSQRRVRSSRDFREIYAARRQVRNRLLTIYYRESATGVSRLGLSVGRRIGNAVARNRVKRLLREAFRAHVDALPGPLDLVVIPRPCRESSSHHHVLSAFAHAVRTLAEKAPSA